MDADAMFNAQYHCAIGNPPYTVPADPALRDAYRARYCSATGQFGLGVPFTERLFQLAGEGGYVGEITSNAFCKREHGKALVEQVLPRLDLTHVLDTSGAFIPGHGTPTVILFGRNRPPTGATVRVVQHKRGEPGRPVGALPASTATAAWFRKPLAAWATRLRELHGCSKADAARAAGAWVLTALMARALEARRVLTAPLPWDAGLPAVFGAVREAAPETWWFDADPAVSHNPRCEVALDPETDAAIRAACRPGDAPEAPDALGRDAWASPDTDWVGDLWQAWDNATVKRFAFCQTPRFVRELILDKTLEPALDEFGRDGFRMIDPACGAGHFLVDAFWRVYQRHADPPDGPPEHTYQRCAELALAAVHGADLNPAVVHLARFRLMLAYCDAATPRTIASVPDDLGIRVVVADALLAGEVRPSPPVWPEAQPAHVVPAPAANGQLSLFGGVA